MICLPFSIECFAPVSVKRFEFQHTAHRRSAAVELIFRSGWNHATLVSASHRLSCRVRPNPFCALVQTHRDRQAYGESSKKSGVPNNKDHERGDHLYPGIKRKKN